MVYTPMAHRHVLSVVTVPYHQIPTQSPSHTVIGGGLAANLHPMPSRTGTCR